MGVGEPVVVVDPVDATRRKRIPPDASGSDLLAPVFRSGERVLELPSLDESKSRCSSELARFHSSIKRLVNPHEYPAGLAENLFDLRNRLILDLKDGE